MKPFHVEVVTPDSAALSCEATSLQIPAWEGYLGVLAQHAPLLTVLRAGVLTLKDEQRVEHYAIRGGFMEVRDNVATVLADDFLSATEVRRSEVERELEEALAPLGEVAGATQEQRAAARRHAEEERDKAIEWARARLKAAEMDER